MSVPMLRGQNAIGAITVNAADVAAFSDNQVKLLQTFADQAVIAIENVRLFKELQEKNRALTSPRAGDRGARATDGDQRDPARDQQLADGRAAGVRRDRDQRRPLAEGALGGAEPNRGRSDRSCRAHEHRRRRRRAWRPSHSRSTPRGRTPRSFATRVRSIPPTSRRDPRMPEATRAMARARGYRSVAVVPLLRHDEAVGAIAVTRREPGGFTDDEIALLQTFADQAVIAIENVRLFKELRGADGRADTIRRGASGARRGRSGDQFHPGSRGPC